MAEIRFDGKVAAITGGGLGIGRTYGLALAARGARVVVNDLGGAGDGTGGSHAVADAVVEEIRAAGGEAVANHASVASAEGGRAIVQTALDHYGTVDILIANAGILRDKTFLKMPLSDFETVVQVHLMGTVYATKAAFPVMKEKGYGRIVVTTSGSGLFGNFGQTNYSAAKLGIVGFANSLRYEGEKHGIKANTIAPLAESRLGEGIFPDEAFRVMRQEFVTSLVLYLASEACASSGMVISAGAGHYARAEMVMAPGVRWPYDADVSPEDIAGRWGEITDLNGAEPMMKPGEYLPRVLGPAMEAMRAKEVEG
jgi:NAD(P)-dependent dehydrogenase (short-subunit alcohol dehydrogenase family)